jgi:hypothetical protein
MKRKFDISGRPSAPRDDAMDRFIEGSEAMTTMTVQIPERLKYALKQAALNEHTTVKALLINIIEAHLAASKQ